MITDPFDSFSGNAGLSGGNKWADYALSASRLDTKGISAASASDGNLERDGYENTTISGKLGIMPLEYVHADFILRYVDSQADLDNAGGAGGDDPNNRAAVEQLFSRAQARVSLFNGFWEQTIGFSLSRQERNYRNDTDAEHPADLDRSFYSGQMLKFDWQHNLRFQETNMLTLGVEMEQEKGESNYYSESAWGPYASEFAQKNTRTTAGYVQDHVRLGDNWFATLGARLDDHSRFGTKITYRIASTYLISRNRDKDQRHLWNRFQGSLTLPALFPLRGRNPETGNKSGLGHRHRTVFLEPQANPGGYLFQQ